MVLQNTRLNLVLKMAKTIANGIHEAQNHYPVKPISLHSPDHSSRKKPLFNVH